MHFWQALKMACKSLWTNKLRSFLTMLGIIIGVMTVSLLTTVASSVSDAVISSIRSQSTLSIIMNTSSMASSMTSASASSKMKYGVVNEVLKDNQHEKNDEDYYDYSIIYSANLPIASDLDGITGSDVDIKDFLHYSSITISDEEYNSMSEEEKFLVDAYRMMNRKPRADVAQVFAVDSNFLDVYDLKIEGRFPLVSDTMDEILVDQEFIKSYLGENVTSKQAIGQKVSLGVKYHTQIVLNFLINVDEETSKLVIDLLENNLKLSITNSSFSESVLTLDVAYYTTVTDDMVKGAIMQAFASMLQAENAITITDIYDYSNYKTYTIVGVLTENADSVVSMSMGENSNGKISFSDLLTSVKGGCYVLLDDSNLSSLNIEATTKDDVVITYAYLRFKNEDVISKRINDLTLSFISSSIIYMQDFMVVSMSSVAKIIGTVMDILTTMLTVISVISLVVGGIGIMNIMLVAVTERTREIGIRKAIGAKRSSILVQFLVEALMLSLVGGGIGLVISAIASAIIASVMGIAISMPIWVVAMSLGFCTAIGLIFGMFPAVKASRMQPIDALRRD